MLQLLGCCRSITKNAPFSTAATLSVCFSPSMRFLIDRETPWLGAAIPPRHGVEHMLAGRVDLDDHFPVQKPREVGVVLRQPCNIDHQKSCTGVKKAVPALAVSEGVLALGIAAGCPFRWQHVLRARSRKRAHDDVDYDDDVDTKHTCIMVQKAFRAKTPLSRRKLDHRRFARVCQAAKVVAFRLWWAQLMMWWQSGLRQRS